MGERSGLWTSGSAGGGAALPQVWPHLRNLRPASGGAAPGPATASPHQKRRKRKASAPEPPPKPLGQEEARRSRPRGGKLSPAPPQNCCLGRLLLGGWEAVAMRGRGRSRRETPVEGGLPPRGMAFLIRGSKRRARAKGQAVARPTRRA